MQYKNNGIRILYKKPSTFYYHLEHANFSHVPQLTLV